MQLYDFRTLALPHTLPPHQAGIKAKSKIRILFKEESLETTPYQRQQGRQKKKRTLKENSVIYALSYSAQ